MATTKLAGKPVQLAGEFPERQSIVKNFSAVKSDLSQFSLDDYKGQRKILNIFPSLDTGLCATSVRTFNKEAASLENTQVICLSFDLPFAHKRFCEAEGIKNVITASLWRTPEAAKSLGVLIESGPMTGLAARAVIVLDEENRVLHAQLMEDISTGPDYAAALAVL